MDHFPTNWGRPVSHSLPGRAHSNPLAAKEKRCDRPVWDLPSPQSGQGCIRRQRPTHTTTRRHRDERPRHQIQGWHHDGSRQPRYVHVFYRVLISEHSQHHMARLRASRTCSVSRPSGITPSSARAATCLTSSTFNDYSTISLSRRSRHRTDTSLARWRYTSTCHKSCTGGAQSSILSGIRSSLVGSKMARGAWRHHIFWEGLMLC